MGVLHSLVEHTRALAAYLPNGRMFEAKLLDGSNLNQLLRGLSGELRAVEGYVLELEREYFPDETELFISEWERAVGIPDACFPGTGTVAERRAHVLVKLAASGVQTAADFVALGALFGKVINVIPLSSLAFPPYDVPFFATGADSRYVIIIEGENLVSGLPPYDVPFDVVAGEDILACVLEQLKPDNTKLLLRNTN